MTPAPPLDQDLAEDLHVSAYEVPGRLVERAPWSTCPGCSLGAPARETAPTRPARTDCDHALELARGGTTCSCNIAPLCRRHQRLRTHTGWACTVIERGTYLWTSPNGHAFLRDHHGTLDISHDRGHDDPGDPVGHPLSHRLGHPPGSLTEPER